MIYKIIAAILTLAGLVLVAKYGQHLPGLVMIVAGLLLGLSKGLPPK